MMFIGDMAHRESGVIMLSNDGMSYHRSSEKGIKGGDVSETYGGGENQATRIWAWLGVTGVAVTSADNQ